MWIKYDDAIHKYRKSLNQGASWADLDLNADQFTYGTLADARLSSNVPLKNATNVFSVPQALNFGHYTNRGNVYVYRNVAHFWENGSSPTGTIKIALPTSWTSTMLHIHITGYEYGTDKGPWEVIVGGYNYIASTQWINYKAEIRGNAPFTSVRLAHDGTKCCILLGTTSTVWSYPAIAVMEVQASQASPDQFASGWVITRVTDETGISGIVTCNPHTYIVNSLYVNSNLLVSGFAQIGGPYPTLYLYQTDGAADEKYTRVITDGTAFMIRLYNDALSLYNTAYQITRSGYQPTVHYFNAWNSATAANRTRVQIDDNCLTSIGRLVGDYGYNSLISGDTYRRFIARADGKLEWGDGANTQDTNLYRGGAHWLYSDDNIYLTNGVFQSNRSATTLWSFLCNISSDGQNRFGIRADGRLEWGNGTDARDVALYRLDSDTLATEDSFAAIKSVVGGLAYYAWVTGDTYSRYRVFADGKIEWGPGNVGSDTNLYRSAANALKTDDDFSANKLTSVNGVYERARTAAIGEFTTPTFAAGDYTANGSMTWTVEAGDVNTMQYTLIGKMMVVIIWLSTTVIGGTVNNTLKVATPGGVTAAKSAMNKCHIVNGGAASDGLMFIDSGAAFISIHRNPSSGNYALGDTYVRGILFFEVT